MKKSILLAACIFHVLEVAAQVTVRIPYCPSPIPEPGAGGQGGDGGLGGTGGSTGDGGTTGGNGGNGTGGGSGGVGGNEGTGGTGGNGGTGGDGGNGTSPVSTTPGVTPVVDSSNGTRSFAGFFPIPSNGPILDGRSYTLGDSSGIDSLTPETCAQYCSTTPFFAIAATTCTCGSAPPAGDPVTSPDQSTPCPTDPTQSCGAPGFAIVYSARNGGLPPVLSSTSIISDTATAQSSLPVDLQATTSGVLSPSSVADSDTASSQAPGVSSIIISSVIASLPSTGPIPSTSGTTDVLAQSSASQALAPSSSSNRASSSTGAAPPSSSKASASSVAAISSSLRASSTTAGGVSSSLKASSAPVSSAPASSKPASSAPASSAPASSAPASSAPASSAPVSSAPAAESTSTSAAAQPTTTSRPPSTSQPPPTTSQASTPTSSQASVSPYPNFSTYTPIPTPASCPPDDKKRRTDPISTEYGTNCGQNLAGDKLKSLHTDSSDICFEACDLRKGCAGVAYLGGDANEANQNFANCQPYANVRGYITDTTQYLVVGVGTDGVNNATDYQPNICTTPQNPSNPDVYTDIVGNQYDITCGRALTTTTNLQATAQDSLSACLTFCSILDSCQGAIFTGTGAPTDNTVANCQAFAAYGTADTPNTNVAYGLLSI